MSFKNQKEIYEALLSGKKVTHDTWNKECFVVLSHDGYTCNQSGGPDGGNFLRPHNWHVYQEKSEPKKLYAYRDILGEIKLYAGTAAPDMIDDFKRAPEYDITYPLESEE